MTKRTAPSRAVVAEIIDRNALKAQQSEYDRDVCVLAVSSVREAISDIPDNIIGKDYIQHVQKNLSELVDSYSDKSGIYTSGRSIIVPILDEIYSLG